MRNPNQTARKQGIRRHLCEKWAKVSDGAIVRIEHRDLDGERKRLEAFKKKTLFGVHNYF